MRSIKRVDGEDNMHFVPIDNANVRNEGGGVWLVCFVIALAFGLIIMGVPFLAWLTGAILYYVWLFVGALLLVAAIVCFIVAIIHCRPKRWAIVLLVLACLMALGILPVLNRYELRTYHGDYITIKPSMRDEDSDIKGRANKFGITVVKPYKSVIVREIEEEEEAGFDMDYMELE